MAEHDIKPEVVTTEATELKTLGYTVGYIRDWKTHNKATSITLKGAGSMTRDLRRERR
ncbi:MULTISPECIES: hypothetical protein [Serratia]|jgi:toxic protein SymE|uniref:hypothetical protein n=1 Tax=Serratia TaxID=613 RepID=UPI002182D619|nr:MULTISPECIES: hypothetical protein [Serratia]MCS4318378.1 hypothetical protein [Serratia sp. BIGb0234]CAI2484034.1 Uncharacterised protein [Serratia liquefaciens]